MRFEYLSASDILKAPLLAWLRQLDCANKERAARFSSQPFYLFWCVKGIEPWIGVDSAGFRGRLERTQLPTFTAVAFHYLKVTSYQTRPYGLGAARVDLRVEHAIHPDADLASHGPVRADTGEGEGLA